MYKIFLNKRVILNWVQDLVLLSSALFMYTVVAETKFVILVASYNNEKYCKWSIKTALNQHYDAQNFRILFIDDHSTDNTLKLVKSTVKNSGKEHLVTYIENTVRKGSPLANHYFAIHKYVHDDEVVVILDGDDGLANTMVLSYLDKIYSAKKHEVWLTYGQYKELYSKKIGFNQQMPSYIVKNNAFRQWQDIPSHLRTFKAWLFKRIKKEHLTLDGDFFSMTGDMAAMIPMIEMARNHYRFVPDVLYIYNDRNPLSEHRVNKQLQRKIDMHIRNLPVYEPLP